LHCRTANQSPVPAKLTVCGLPPPEPAMETVALRAPFFVGVKVALTSQFAPAARGLGVEQLSSLCE